MSKDTRASRWSLTVWMPPYTEQSAKEMLERAIQLNPKWSIEGQMEAGKKDGKLHYQLMVKTDQQRHSALRKAFPSCHVEAARNVKALENYVHKEDTRHAEFKTIENRFPTWQVVRNKFFDYLVSELDKDDVFNISCIQDDDDKLYKWDIFIASSIREGIECDLIGVNPQYRSCIMRYWGSYISSAYNRQTSVEVSRQTDIQEASLPMSI